MAGLRSRHSDEPSHDAPGGASGTALVSGSGNGDALEWMGMSMIVTYQGRVKPEILLISLDRIVSKLPVRRLSASGVARIQASMKRSGYLDNFPLVITPLNDITPWVERDYQLIDGNHRYEAALALGISPVPCILKMRLPPEMHKYGPTLPENEQYTIALQANQASESMVPSTLVTYAEFIWARASEGKTQHEIADMMGWSREKVKNYASLKQIIPLAWEVIGTTFEDIVPMTDEGIVPTNGTTVPVFTEGLLRSILDLSPDQQLELVSALAKGDIQKGRFKTLAESYHARNEIKFYVLQQLGTLDAEFFTDACTEIDKGFYDKDWIDSKEHLKIQKLIAATRDAWERKHSIHLIHGDFSVEVQKIGDGCIDLILTDPPYNIARDRNFELTGRSTISQDFGEWDKYEHRAFIEMLQGWVREWERILKPGGSGYVFISDRYISHMREALLATGLQVMSTLTWCKNNPGTSVYKDNFISSTEFILYFTKKGDRTFNWQGENEMRNFFTGPLCAGKERLTDAKGNTLHPTQKPEYLLFHLLDISSNPGDTIFDGFAGTGTTGKVAKDKGRKFIGIEKDFTFFEAMQKRLVDD